MDDAERMVMAIEFRPFGLGSKAADLLDLLASYQVESYDLDEHSAK